MYSKEKPNKLSCDFHFHFDMFWLPSKPPTKGNEK